MFAILKCCAWVQIVKQTCPRLKTSPQPVRQLSPNLYLMGKYEDLVESESVWWRPCNATHSTHTLAQWSQQYNKCPRQIFLAVARIVDYLHYVFLDGFASEALS